MRTKGLVFGACAFAALLIASCTKTTPTGGGATPQTSTISGWVERSDDLSKVPNVLVYDTRGTAPPDTTKSDGSFKLTYNLTANYTGTIVASRVTFGSDTINVNLIPGANDTLPRILILKADTNSQKTAASSGQVASIVLVAGGDVSTIAIRGTGFTESTPLTFEARDSLGITVSGKNKTTIYFSLLGGPGGGEYLYPTSAVTDLTGRVVTRVASGTKPGVLQVFAYARPDSTKPDYIVTSSPIRLTISGGLPDAAHFSMSVQKLNIAGMSYDNLRDNIAVIVGDKDGNPVQAGTAVYFSTTGGIIQPSASTDKDGAASVSLISANPRPATGQVFVTARTIGDSGRTISQTVPILFTGPPKISAPPSNFQIGDSGSYDFTYMVSDSNGNPLSSGSTIAVTVDGPGSGDLDLKGDVSKTTTDTQDKTLTLFSVQVQDRTHGGAAGLVTFTITVTGDNGTASASWWGTQLPEGVTLSGSSTGQAASIQLLGASTNSISVRGTGQLETAVLHYAVKDSLGNPITQANAVTLTFTIQNGPGGGEYVFPSSALTDVTGKASTAVNAGTKSGVVQVVASTLVGGVLPLKSSPVQLTIASGLADAAHSTMWATAVNFPILVSPGKSVGTVSVQLGDIYNNPAQSSAVYFTTNGGLITATSLSSTSGLATADLKGGGQLPPGGIDTITSVTQGNQNITQFLVVTASGAPIITAPSSIPNISSGGFGDLFYDVKDLNGNPLAAGNAVSVTLTGDGASQLALSGSTNFTTRDTRDTSSVHYHVKLDNSGGGSKGGAFIATIAVAGPNGTAVRDVSGYLQAEGVISGGGGGTGNIASLVLASVSSTDISVKGTGAVETATLIFQGKDSLGADVDQTHGSMINFVISQPSLGAIASVPSMQTDASGRATTLIESGFTSGVIQVTATTVVNGVTISSLPVRISIHAGLPDQRHFTMGPAEFNFPALQHNGLTNQIIVQMGDLYSNPVQEGTIAYFSSTHGIIQTQASLTDINGFTSQSLYSANPRPVGNDTISWGPGRHYMVSLDPGWTRVYAETKDSIGETVMDSLNILWTGSPIITPISGPATVTIGPGGGAGPWVFEVADYLGHPMSSGTSISVTGSGVTVTGQASIPMPDVTVSGNGTTIFSVAVTNANGGPSPLPAPIISYLTVTVNHPVYGSFTYNLCQYTAQ